MSTEINTRTQSYPTTIAKGAAIGAGLGTLYAAGKKALPVAQDSYKASIQQQENKIGVCKKWISNIAEKIKADPKLADKYDATVDGFVKNEVRKARSMESAQSVYSTMSEFAKKENQQGAESYAAAFQKTVAKGTDAKVKEIQKSQKMLEKGKASKTKAAKEAVVDTLSKAKNKVSTEFSKFKEIKGTKAKFAYVKEKALNKQTLKKAAPILIGMAATAAVLTGAKAILDHSKAKKEEK